MSFESQPTLNGTLVRHAASNRHEAAVFTEFFRESSEHASEVEIVDSVVFFVSPGNARSQRAMEKIGGGEFRSGKHVNQRNAMDAATPAVQEFFDQYARSRSTMDIDRIASQYADSCMLAAADGAQVAEKPAILAGFTKALALLKTVGHTSTRVSSLDETSVDEHYAMVRAQFVWRFEKAAAPPIDVEVDSMFILYFKDDVRKIVLHHEHEDFWQVLRTRGVLPLQG